MAEGKRVDDLREDVQELRHEMHAGFNSLEKKFNDSRNATKSQNKEIVDEQNKDIDAINCVLKEHDERITVIDNKHTKNYNNLHALFIEKFNDLDKRLFKLFFIGNIIGMAAGSVITMFIQFAVKNL